MGARVGSYDGDDGVQSRVQSPRDLTPGFLKYALWGGLVLFVLIFLMSLNPFNSVPTGSRGVVTQFGKIKSVEGEGMTLLPPWQKMNLFSIRAEKADIKDAGGSTSDTQPVDTSLTVRYSINPDKVSFVYEKYSHDGDLSSYVQTATQEVFKAVTAKYTAVDLISKRAQVSSDIKDALGVKLAHYGAEVDNIDMTNFQFGQAYMAAIERKVVQEQERLAAENKVKTVQAEQQSNVVTAQAHADALKAKADGEAYATLAAAKAAAEQTRLNADAQAESIKVQQAALAQGQQVLELKRIAVEQTKAERWNGELPQNIYGASPALYMNVNPNQLQK